MIYDGLDYATRRKLVEKVDVAENLIAAGIGLMGSTALARPALLLKRVSCVHTFGMLYSLDMAFFDGRGFCLRRVDGVKPGRVIFGPWRTVSVLETKAARPSVLKMIELGTRVLFVPSGETPAVERSSE